MQAGMLSVLASLQWEMTRAAEVDLAVEKDGVGSTGK